MKKILIVVLVVLLVVYSGCFTGVSHAEHYELLKERDELLERIEEYERQEELENSETQRLAEARMIVSALSAHNALAEANGENCITALPATVEAFNMASDIDVNSLSEEEYEEALSAYWDNVDRKYDEWKDDKLMGDDK